MLSGWRLLFSGLILGAVLALLPSAFAQYPSPAEINLPEPPRIFQSLGDLGRKVIRFFGIEALTRELQNIDLHGLFAKGKRIVSEKIPQYRAELRRFCPSGCSLPEILRSGWHRIRSWFGR